MGKASFFLSLSSPSPSSSSSLIIWKESTPRSHSTIHWPGLCHTSTPSCKESWGSGLLIWESGFCFWLTEWGSARLRRGGTILQQLAAKTILCIYQKITSSSRVCVKHSLFHEVFPDFETRNYFFIFQNTLKNCRNWQKTSLGMIKLLLQQNIN